MRGLPVAAFGAWFVWFLLVASHYFVIPPELLVILDYPLNGAPHWSEATRETLRGLSGAALVYLAAWGAALPALHATKGMFETALERVTIALAIGFGLLGSLFFALALFGLYQPSIVATTLVILAATGAVALLGSRPRFTRPARVSWCEAAYALAIGAALVCSFVAAVAPEIEYDALWYHLWLPAKWLEAGRPVDIVEEYVSLYPLGWDIVSGGALVLGGPVAAKLVHFGCLPLTAACAYLLTSRLFPAASGVLAAALAIVTPITVWEAGTAYLDLAMGWYVGVSVYAFTRYHDSGNRRWLIVSALVMGAALASKHLALVALAILSAAIGVREVIAGRNLTGALKTAALFVAVSIAVPTPWYIRAYTASGNPVFPDLYGVFGAKPAERWSPVTERGLQAFKDRFGRGRTARSLARLPWDATVHAAAFGGTLGPAFLIFAPAILVGRRSRAALALAGGLVAYVAVWASPVSSFQMRFLVPIVPLLATLSAEGATQVLRAARAFSPGAPYAVVVPLWAMLMLNLPPTSEWHEADRNGDKGWMTHILRGLPVAVVIGAESREGYLRRTVPSYAAWQYINTTLPEASKILTFSGGDHLYSARARVSSDATVARPATWGTPTEEYPTALRALQTLSVTHVLFDKRQLQDGSLGTIAIASEAMLTCCLSAVYEDSRFVLHRIEAKTTPSSSPDAAR